MSKLQLWDRFLTITTIVVVAGFFYALASWDQFETDRDDHRQSQHKGE